MKRLFASALILASLFAPNSIAAPPKAENPPWKLFVANAVAATDGAQRSTILVPGMTPGTWVVVVNGRDLWSLTPMSIDPPSPQPPPTPTPPTPPPTPQPSIKPCWIGVIHEGRDSTPAVATVRDGRAWKDACSAAGLLWLVMDKDQALKLFPNQTQAAIAAGLPAVVTVYDTKTWTTDRLPANLETMVNLVKAKAGVK